MAARVRTGGLRFSALVVALIVGALLALGWMVHAGQPPAGLDVRMAARDVAPPSFPEPPGAPGVLPPGG